MIGKTVFTFLYLGICIMNWQDYLNLYLQFYIKGDLIQDTGTLDYWVISSVVNSNQLITLPINIKFLEISAKYQLLKFVKFYRQWDNVRFDSYWNFEPDCYESYNENVYYIFFRSYNYKIITRTKQKYKLVQDQGQRGGGMGVFRTMSFIIMSLLYILFLYFLHFWGMRRGTGEMYVIDNFCF